MSSELALRVANLSKCYEIYDQPHDRLKQSIMPRLQRLAGRAPRKYYREFWALKDVSLDIARGETVGVIGRNGSGKSTLLQLVCGTLTPTGGHVETHGRIAALLELGAGFNPEFTGRENVYMNAAILGLTGPEINARIDEIIDFADIGDFIDQPVKIYSSGMFVRLAFAVAANVDPQILIVDEALSVGDLAFQNKCILRIKQMRDRGTTLLFVTHELSILQMICDRVVWLHHGQVVTAGNPVAVCQEYYVGVTGAQTPESIRAAVIPQKETGMAKVVEVVHDGFLPGKPPVYQVGESIRLRFTVLAEKPLAKGAFTCSIFRVDRDWTLGQTSVEAGVFWPECEAGESLRGRLILEPNCLAPGDYMVAIGVNSEDLSICYALSELTVPFSVRWNHPTWGKFIHPCRWEPLPTLPAGGSAAAPVTGATT